MQLIRSARLLLPAILLSVLPSLSHAEVFHGGGFALHMLPALGQAATPADATPTPQPQAPEKPIANRKHLNVAVGPLRMHLPVSGKRPVTPAAPANGNTGQALPVLVHPVQQPLGQPAFVEQVQTTPGAVGQAGVPANGEKTNTLTIQGNDQQRRRLQAGTGDVVVGGQVARDGDVEQPITFRWTPVLTNPQDPVTYRVTVWQLMQGQTGAQAITVNPPILTKLVDEPNLAFRSDAVTGPCLSPHLCGYVWKVQALDRMGRPIEGYNDSQQVAAFRYDAQSGAFTVQQPNSPIVNNAAGKKGKAGKTTISYDGATGLKKPKKSTGQNQKQYILGVNMTFLMVAPPRGGGNQPGGAQPMATPGPSASGAQTNQGTGVGPNPTQVNLEQGKLKQNPQYIMNRGTPQGGGNPPGHEQRRKYLDKAPVGTLSQSLSEQNGTAVPAAAPGFNTNMLGQGGTQESGKTRSKGVYSMNDGVTDQPARQGGTATPQTPGTVSYSIKVVEYRDDATVTQGAPLPAQPKGITATANNSSASGTKNAVIPNPAAPSPTQPKPGMIFDRWGNLVVEPGPEQPRMNTGAAPTQTKTKKIPVGGGAPVVIGSGFTALPPGKQATPQTRVGPCPPRMICRGEDGQPADAVTVPGTPGGSANAPLTGSGRQATQTFTVTNSGGATSSPNSAINPALNQNGTTTTTGGVTSGGAHYSPKAQQPGGSPQAPAARGVYGYPSNPNIGQLTAEKPQTPKAIGASANGQSANAKNAANPGHTAPQPLTAPPPPPRHK